MTTQNADEILHAFATKLLEEKRLENVDPEVLENLKADLMDRLEDRMNMVILKNIPEEKLPEFESLLENGTPEALQAFSASTIPDLQNILAAELMLFRKTYLGLE